ncbi:hypothetical protein PCANC_04321 [Puccinia coronata f. sp. avenae]|uniref:Integrase catalytic domain-containing protein n=1 Tax=Puccinia coronata f. sp. avenae TaxID=200324 RepID=A0A2N5VUL2_9BASI|nr:hypothetical protein PCANC_04321 [Puccinia coronata f. sp. avenae]
MTSEQSLRYSLPILTNTTFAVWKTQILAYCMEYNLDNYLLRDIAAPPASETDKLEQYESRRGKAAGILVRCMGQINNNKFVTDTNRRNPRALWKLLTDHYESKSADNQAKVYQAFCNFKFAKDLSTFYDDLNSHLANMTSVGLKVGIPADFHIHEHLLAEQIVGKLPDSLLATKDYLFTKRPLSLDTVKEHIQSKISNSTAYVSNSEPISIKTESAMTAKGNYCENGTHNPASTTHTAKNCWELHPQKKGKKTAPKKQAKSALNDDSDQDNTSVASDGAYRCIKKKRAFSAHSKTTMFLDSGCLDHMFPKKEGFVDYKKISSSIEIADGKSMNVEGSGYVFVDNGMGSKVKLKALHVPRIVHPLISAGRLYCKGCVIQKSPTESDLNSTKFVVMDLHSDSPIFTGLVQGNVFVLNGTVSRSRGEHSHPPLKAAMAKSTNISILHKRAGHPSREALKKMFNADVSTLDCRACCLSKSTLLPFSNHLPAPLRLLEFIYMDLSGKITPPTLGGGLYYFKITDAFSYFCHKCSIVNVITDGGGEFTSNEFEKFFSDNGITHHVTAPYTPQQNSVAERGNRTTSEKARALLKEANLPPELWGEAVATAVLYENITPTCKIKWKTPHEYWFGRKFNYNRLRVFGCKAYVNIPKERRVGKFGNTAKEGILLGYRLGIPNWRILIPGNRVEYSHNVIFDETEFPGISTDYPAGEVPVFDEEDCANNPPVFLSQPVAPPTIPPPGSPLPSDHSSLELGDWTGNNIQDSFQTAPTSAETP